MSPHRLLKSSSFRLALIYMALFGASVLLLLGFLYWATAGYMARQADAAIATEIEGLAEHYRQTGTPGLIGVIRERIARDPGGASIYLLAAPRGIPLIGNINRWPDAEPGPDGWLDFHLTDKSAGEGEPHRARARQFRLDDGLMLLVGRDVRDLEATTALIERAFVWGLGITLLLGAVGGGMMSSGLLRRIEAINQTSREIIEGDLSRRVPTAGSGDEFDQLAGGLNRMLDRIQELMASIRQVSDNIAHDLRTPLARLRTELEDALDDKLDDASRARIERALAEADGLLATFGALLRIARIEASDRTGEREVLDLTELAGDAVEFYAPLAEEVQSRIVLAAETGLCVAADRDLLFQALANLLDNAVKFAPNGTEIIVTVARRTNRIELVVADHGPGIPEEMRDKVRERFFRLETSRTTPGNGLGLSLVAAVAKLHGAELRLEDNDPGLRAVLAFPTESETPRRPVAEEARSGVPRLTAQSSG